MHTKITNLDSSLRLSPIKTQIAIVGFKLKFPQILDTGQLKRIVVLLIGH